jgi:hypothetical protein
MLKWWENLRQEELGVNGGIILKRILKKHSSRARTAFIFVENMDNWLADVKAAKK